MFPCRTHGGLSHVTGRSHQQSQHFILYLCPILFCPHHCFPWLTLTPLSPLEPAVSFLFFFFGWGGSLFTKKHSMPHYEMHWVRNGKERATKLCWHADTRLSAGQRPQPACPFSDASFSKITDDSALELCSSLNRSPELGRLRSHVPWAAFLGSEPRGLGGAVEDSDTAEGPRLPLS